MSSICAIGTARAGPSASLVGWELRGLVAPEMPQTQVCKTEVHQTEATWRAEAVAKGWAVAAPSHRLGDRMDIDRQGGLNE